MASFAHGRGGLNRDPEKKEGALRLLGERLGGFEGSFDAGVVRAVCTGRGVARSLVQDLLATLEAEGRVRPIEGLRPKRWQVIGPRGTGDPLFGERHARYFERLSALARPRFGGPRQRQWLDRFEHEVPNLRQATRWSLANGAPERALSIAVANFALWYKRGLAAEGLEWTTRALDACGAAPRPLRLDGLNAAGMLQSAAGSPAKGRRLLREALELAWDLDDHAAEAAILSNLGVTFRDEGDLDEARKALGSAVNLWRSLGSDSRLANSLVNLAAVMIAQDRDDEASPLLAEAERTYDHLDDPWSRAMVGSTLADLSMRRGEMARAREELSRSIRTFGDLKDPRGLAICFKLLSALEATMGRYRRAAVLFGAAEAALSAAHAELAAIELAPLMATVEEVREVLGEDEYDASWMRGNELPLAEAIAFALQ